MELEAGIRALFLAQKRWSELWAFSRPSLLNWVNKHRQTEGESKENWHNIFSGRVCLLATNGTKIICCLLVRRRRRLNLRGPFVPLSALRARSVDCFQVSSSSSSHTEHSTTQQESQVVAKSVFT